MGTDASYMSSLPVSFQEMADVNPVVEGVDWPAHKQILAANSKVFAELFTSQAASSKSQVPLADETLQDATIALTYLYRNCVFSTSALSVDCAQDAKALIRFGHKYGMQGMLDAMKSNVVTQIRQTHPETGEYVLMKSNKDVASWTAIAEKCGLRELLAHCEDFMMKDGDEELWHDKALVGEEVSRASLLRILRGLQWSRVKLGQSNPRPAAEIDVGIPMLLEWQKSDEA